MSPRSWVVGAAWFLPLLSSWYLIPFGYRLYREKQLGDRCRAHKTIVLTYDDGPGEELTPRLLRLLDERGVVATFFVLGRRVEALPDLHSQVLAYGHEVGSHTFDHTNAWKASPAKFKRDMRRGITSVGEHGGDTRLFRPPYGKLTMVSLLDGFRIGLRMGWWTVDSGDSWRRRPIPEVVAELEERGGGVLLMHDFDEYDSGETDTSHIDHVLALTASVIDFAECRGLRFATLGEVVSQRMK